MDHEAALEAMEIAAAEPGGLDRLMAGDTATAMAVAAHLAGCPECTLELERWRTVAARVSQVVAETPSPELRDRTLAHVRRYGRERSAAVTPAPVATTDLAAARDRRRRTIGWLATIAAAVAISVVTTTLLVGARVDDRLAAQDAAIEDLAAVTTATLHVTAEPDVERVTLAGAPGTTTSGTLLYSPSTTETVIVADGLSEPPDGQLYKCWVLVDGQRQAIGRMFFGGGLAYWVGPSPAVADLPAGATFGVSLVGADGTVIGSDPVMSSAT